MPRVITIPLIVLSSLLILVAVTASAQEKRPALAGPATAAARICADPYSVRESADGMPEAPVAILFHHEKSKAPWTRNPAIKLTGLEAITPSSAKTVVCLEESRYEVGRYDSGEPAYSPSWQAILVRLSDRKVYFMRVGFHGEEPPGLKFHRGAGVGKPPIEKFTQWLRLLVGQKVARLKTRISLKEFHEVSGLAFSSDGSRLLVAQEPRSTLGGTPAAPFTVFDLATTQPLATMHADFRSRRIAISQSGRWIATELYGHPQVWDVGSGRIVKEFEKAEIESLAFGSDDTLAVAGGNKAALFDFHTGRELRTTQGAILAPLPGGGWLVARKTHAGFTVQEWDSGRVLADFPTAGPEDKVSISGDGLAFAHSSVLGASMYVSGSADSRSLTLPNLGVDLLSAIAPTRDGFVVGNSDGIAGIVSRSSPEPKPFATHHTSISAIAVSDDGKLVALGDSSGTVSIWELR